MMQKDYFGIELSGSVRLALPLKDLIKVIQIQPHKICFIPGMSTFWLGVINHQGSLLWVLDTNCFLNIASNNHNSNKNLTTVIIQHRSKKTQRQLALTVNKLRGIMTLNKPPSLGITSSLSSEYQPLVQGTILENGTAIDILDSSKFFQFIHTSNTLNSLPENIS